MTTPRTWLARIRRPVLVWALTALAVDVVAKWVVAADPALPTMAQQALMLGPLVPLLGFVGALVRAVRHMDELQQRICLESVFIAFVASLTLIFVFTGLGESGMWQPRWEMIGTAMMALWAGGYVYASWKYR
jgi:hypothetical protein